MQKVSKVGKNNAKYAKGRKRIQKYVIKVQNMQNHAKRINPSFHKGRT